jgi:hypothetical protein
MQINVTIKSASSPRKSRARMRRETGAAAAPMTRR